MRCRNHVFFLAGVARAAALALFVCGLARAAEAPSTKAATAPELLRAYTAALRAAAVPSEAAAAVVLPLAAGGVRLAVNEAVPMNPASAMKLVTTYAALALLGPNYTWRTEAFAAGTLRGDVLAGDLVLRGSGDPKLVIENLWLLVEQIRAWGVREIRGDVVLDRSAFAPIAHDPAAFDGELLRPHNTGPDALLVNFKAVSFGFVPDPDAGTVRVTVTPRLVGLRVPQTIRGEAGPCNDWRARLRPDFSDPLAPVFRGAFPYACGERVLLVSVLTHERYFAAAFGALWESAGGAWSGRVRAGSVPPGARRIAVHESPPLAQVIRDINKFSNNVMARQLFLTISAETMKLPGSYENSARTVRAWLAQQGMDWPELVLENGAGLSRIERISAAHLAQLLVHAFNGPLMPEFVASLPLAGVDGTMKTRQAAAGYAHVKTGLLAGVRAIAGYVLAASGRRYVVVAFVNHPNAAAAQPAHDALLEWVYRNG